jgi:hypothetical protein
VQENYTTAVFLRKWLGSGEDAEGGLLEGRSKKGYCRGATTFSFTPCEGATSVLVKRKVDVKTVQELLPHQNLKTALEIYAKLMTEDKLGSISESRQGSAASEEKKGHS